MGKRFRKGKVTTFFKIISARGRTEEIYVLSLVTMLADKSVFMGNWLLRWPKEHFILNLN